MARTQTATKTAAVKPLNPRQADQKYMGDEPVWHIQPEDNRKIEVIYAWRWYNYYYGRKDAKDFVAQWLEHHDRKADAKKYRAASESVMDKLPLGWLARMNLVGLHLQEEEQHELELHIRSAIATPEQVATVVDDSPAKPNIQDRLREKARECAGEIEGLYDELVSKDYKLNADFKPGVVIRSMNVQPQQISIISDAFKTRLSEFNEVLAGKDEQLVEGYSHLNKSQLKTAIKFCELVINDCAAHVQHKKAERKPRAKKAVSPEKVAAKFKFAREAADIKLASEPPAKLVNATEAWLYDSAKRKIIHVVADPHLNTFTIKGSSVVGFDAANTEMKTLRKPAEQVAEMFTNGKPGARKYFKDIKTTAAKWNGRSNENLVILRVW